jgi:hypothetical protein
MTVATLKSTVAGSPVRLKATAQSWPGFLDSARRASRGVRIEAFNRFADGEAVVGSHEEQGAIVGDFRHPGRPCDRASGMRVSSPLPMKETDN